MVNVTADGRFDLESYSYQTGSDIEQLRSILDDLSGLSYSWDVTVYGPDDYDPHGRVVIRHSCFNEHTEIVVASTYDGTSFSHSVYHAMETDILTHAEEVGVLEALRTAVEVANQERRRQSRVLPPYSLPKPLSGLRSPRP